MKNRTYYKHALLWLACITIPFYGVGQTYDELCRQFPDANAVLLNRTLAYNISLKNGRPHVESRKTEQIAYLRNNGVAYSSDYSFSHSDFQKLGSYSAFTKTADGQKLKVTDFKTTGSKDASVFYDDYKITSFNFPAAGPGAIGNLDVSWQNSEPSLLSPYYFSSYIPVVSSTLKLTVTKDIQIKYRLKGLDTTRVKVTVENNRGNTVYTLTSTNNPPDLRYPDAPGFGWFATHAVFYIEKYKAADNKQVSFLANTDDLYRISYDYVKNINTAVSPQVKRITDSLTAELTDPRLKVKAIYNWVQHHIKYVAFENGMEGFIPRDAGLVCNRRFGDCKDMSSILTQMINTAGVPAYFTWIGTRNLPYNFSDLPLPLVSNHMICTVKLDSEYVFLDGTDPTCIFGTPSSHIQGKEAMVGFGPDTYKILNVPVPAKTANVLADTTWLELTPNGVKGRIRQTLTGYYASDVNAKLMYMNARSVEQVMREEFTRGSNNFKLDTFIVIKGADAAHAGLEARFTLPDYAKKIGNDQYLNLNLFKFFAGEEIDHPRRKMQVENDFKYIRRYVTMLKIPPGNKVTYMPQSKKFHNELWGFDLRYEQKGDQVILTQEFDNDTLLLTNDQFQTWNNVLLQLLPMYKETLSLTKT